MTAAADRLGARPARAAIAAGALLLAGCATVPPDAGNNPRDPLERFNRHVFAFNDGFDRYFMKPVARSYVWLLPAGVRLCINSGFANIGEIRNAVNDILQIKPAGAATDTGRLVINSTLGVLGCFDVAKKMGLQRRHEDFGLTLARYGVGTGPYVVLPLLGPSDVRDGIGLAADSYTNPINYVQVAPVSDRWTVLGVYLIDTRADLLEATDLIDRTALDRYQFTRDSYLQRRMNLQYEGNPPPLPEEDDSGESGPGATGTKDKPAETAPGNQR
ncbi:MAG TPA: VacJ family lipoprotein [Burkholderiaceae bacterium]|nr:VacJ family lipoprotein [Burkholderiaceae bacterium]